MIAKDGYCEEGIDKVTLALLNKFWFLRDNVRDYGYTVLLDSPFSG